MTEIGLFCGTFNPIHLGHLLIAECARDQFKLDHVLFVTSPAPPHRNVGLLDGEARHKLVEAAVAPNKYFRASRLELSRPGPSYTVDTVKEVLSASAKAGENEGKSVRVNLIIGGDNLPFLKDWHNSAELLSLCRLLVVPRLRYLSESQSQEKSEVGADVVQTITQSPQPSAVDIPNFELVDFPGIAISASNIRKRISLNKTVLYMVPAEVDALIKSGNYYREYV
jgi:nicotinate-nucleotide adenylyltransferase